MEIRKAEERDLPRIMEIYAHARAFMAAHGNPKQWGATNWPPEEAVRRSIRAGENYVCLNDAGCVAGTFYYSQGPDAEPLYKNLTEGRWFDDSPYGVVHRIATDHSEKGIGAFCLNWAYEQCPHQRIDTHGDNTVMQNLLKKLGYVYCGVTHVAQDNDPRLAFEKSARIPARPDNKNET